MSSPRAGADSSSADVDAQKKAAMDKEHKAREEIQRQYANANSNMAHVKGRAGALSQWERLDAVDAKAPPKVDGACSVDSKKHITEFLEPGTYKRNDVKLHLGKDGVVSADYAVTDSQYRKQFSEAYDLLAMEGGGCNTMKPVIGEASPFTRERLNIHFELAAERGLMLDLSDNNMQKFLNSLPEQEQKMYRDAQNQLELNYKQREALTDLAQSGAHEVNATNISKEQKFLVQSLEKELDKQIAELAKATPRDDKKIQELEEQKNALQKNENDFTKKLMQGTNAEQVKTLSNELDETKKRFTQVHHALEQVESAQKSTSELLKAGAAEKVGATADIKLPTSGVGTRLVSALTGGLQAATSGGVNTSMSAAEVLAQAKTSNIYNVAAEKKLFKEIDHELRTLVKREDQMKIQRENLNEAAKKLGGGDEKTNLEKQIKSLDKSLAELNEQKNKVYELHQKVHQNGKSLSEGLGEQLQEKMDKDKSAAPTARR